MSAVRLRQTSCLCRRDSGTSQKVAEMAGPVCPGVTSHTQAQATGRTLLALSVPFPVNISLFLITWLLFLLILEEKMTSRKQDAFDTLEVPGLQTQHTWLVSAAVSCSEERVGASVSWAEERE